MNIKKYNFRIYYSIIYFNGADNSQRGNKRAVIKDLGHF